MSGYRSFVKNSPGTEWRGNCLGILAIANPGGVTVILFVVHGFIITGKVVVVNMFWKINNIMKIHEIINEAPSGKKVAKEIGKGVGKHVGSAAGAAVAGKIGGTRVGAALGTALSPGMGTALGAMIGGAIGSEIGDRVVDKVMSDEEEEITETNGSQSAIPGRSLRPQNSKSAMARRNVENIMSGGMPNKK